MSDKDSRALVPIKKVPPPSVRQNGLSIITTFSACQRKLET